MPIIGPCGGSARRVTANGVAMFYKEAGAGDPVLLLHGGIMDHQSWGNQFDILAQHFHVIAPDTRGHGQSRDPGDAFGYRIFAEDVAALMDSLGISSAHIVGFSDGGCTALQLGIHHPRRIRQLILLGTPYHTHNYPAAIRALFPVITPETLFQIGSPALLEAIRVAQAHYASSDRWTRFFVKLVNGMWAREPDLSLDELTRISVPILILHAEKEEFYDLEVSQAMARSLSAEIKVVPGASHMSAQEHPAFVNASLLEFLSRR